MKIRSLPGLLLLAAVLLFVVPSASEFYTNWLWFIELGYERLFLRSMNAQAVVFAATFAAVFVFVFLNLHLARRRTLDRPHVVLGTTVDGRPISLESRRIAGLALPIAVVLALLVGISGASNWLSWLTFIHGVPFGQIDPLFHLDVGYYVYRLPIYQSLRDQMLVVSLLTLAGCAAYYVFSGSFMVDGRRGATGWPKIRLMPAARRHLSLLAAFIFGLLAWGTWLGIYGTMLSPTPASVVSFGISYADLYAGIPFMKATFAALVAGVGLAIWHGFGRRGWPLPLAVGLYFVISITGGLYASVLQRVVVTPNEQGKEQPFILNNIAATRKAYALDRVEERELSGDAELTPQDVIANAGTIENVRLWDHQPLLQTFAQIQEIRTYYDFLNVDNDRYMVNGKYQQVMLSARELNTELMPNRSWVNEHLQFTHGYGLTLGPVNQVTTEGLPVLYIRDLPPVSTIDLQLEQPSIYYGELANSYVLVKTREPEFHYPSGDNNEKTFYNGTGGVPLGSFFRRLMFALRFASTDILVTNQITRDTRIMFHRQIADRVKVIAPFLTYDFDPYPVVTDGRLFWMQDAYTTTANYPYATPIMRGSQPLNYIRNSVKIVTDAYNGDVRFFLAESDDPLAATLQRIFPGLFRPMSEMPAGLRQHVRYPEEIFKIQAEVYRTYHMTNPQVFYNKEDQYNVPTLETAQASAPMQPYYTIMRLPGEQKQEFIQMLPFTPRAKDNLAAWMVARSDGDHYGHLMVFQFPKRKIVYGPNQIRGRINQDEIISPQITLWSQQGSEVIWGTLLVIPIKESLIYVSPLYLRSPQGKIPELKRVIVAYQDRIVMAETLTKALGEIFGRNVATALAPDQLASTATSVVQTPIETAPVAGIPTVEPVGDQSLAALAAEANLHYERMNKARVDGDWSLYGEEWKLLGDAIAKMDKASKIKR